MGNSDFFLIFVPITPKTRSIMLKKSLLLMALMIGFTSTISAEEQEVQNTQQEKEKKTIELPQWVKNIKFSGYAMLQYQGQDPEGNHSNTFNLRLARFILDGKIGDFDWRAQIQGTNATGPGQPTVPPFNSLTSMQNGEDSQSSRFAQVSSSVRSPLRTPRTPSHKAGVVMLT